MIHPQAIEAENAVLGSLLLEPSCIQHVSIADDDFHDSKNAAAFAAIRRMLDEGPSDTVALQLGLKDAGVIKSFDEASVWLSTATSSAMLERHVAIIKRSNARRKLTTIGHNLTTGKYDIDPRVAAALAMEELKQASGAVTSDASPHCQGFIDEFIEASKVPSISTGFKSVDDGMEGGLHVGGTVMVGGDSGAGKTMLVLCFIRQCLKMATPCYMVSRDQTEKDIMGKLLAASFSVRREELKSHPNLESWRQIAMGWPLWFYPRSESFDVDSVCAEIKSAVASHGVRVWVADYLQRIELRGYPELGSDHARYEKIAAKLADLAQDTKTSGIIISRVTKPGSGVATQHRFAGGAGTQNACDDMLFVHNYEFHDDAKKDLFGKGGVRVLELIGKRNFTSGLIDLKVDYPFDRYKEWSKWTFQEQTAWNEEQRG